MVYTGWLNRRPTKAALLRTLAGIVEATGLHAISEPIARCEWEDDGWPKGGPGARYSAIVVIAESHVAIEGDGRHCFLTVASCALPGERAIMGQLEQRLPGAWRQTDYATSRSGRE